MKEGEAMVLEKYCQTYLTLEVRGPHVSRLLSQASKQGFVLYDIKPLSYDHHERITAVRFRLEGRNLKGLRHIRRETRSHLRIIEKKGFPVLLRTLMRRQGFMIGFFLFIFVLVMLSQILWSVEVSGTETLSVEHVKTAAFTIGLKPGAWKPSLPPINHLEEALLKALPEASWVGVRLDGVVARITVLEKKRPPEPSFHSPQSLVASKKAVIVDYFVRRGRPVIRPNMLVRPGDTLVSGILGLDSPNPRLVSADGEVYGEVWYDVEVSMPLKRTLPLLTGVQGKRMYIQLAGRAFPFWGARPPQPTDTTSYITTQDGQPLSIGPLKLPLTIVTEHWYEMRPEWLEESAEAIKEEALALARESIKRHGHNVREIKEEKILQERLEDDKVYIKVHYGVVENIAIPRVITELPPKENGAD